MEKNIKILFKNLVFILIGLLIIIPSNAYAGEDNLEISIKTDKNIYTDGEKINAVVNVRNTESVNIKNLKINIALPDSLSVENDNDLSKTFEEIKMGDTLEYPLSLKYLKKSSDSNDLSNIVFLVIMLMASVALMYLSKKQKVFFILGFFISVELFSINSVEAKTISNSFNTTYNLVINDENQAIDFSISYDKFEESDYNITDNQKSEISSVIAELFTINQSNKISDGTEQWADGCKVKNGIPSTDRAKTNLLYHVILSGKIQQYDPKTDISFTIDGFNNLLTNLIDKQITSVTDDVYWKYNSADNTYKLFRLSRGDSWPEAIIDNVKQISETEVSITGTVRNKGYVYIDEAEYNFTARAKINPNSQFGNVTITNFDYDLTELKNYTNNEHPENIEYARLLRNSEWLVKNTLFASNSNFLPGNTSLKDGDVVFYICDLDNNGVNELLFTQGKSAAQKELLICSYSNGNLIQNKVPLSHGEIQKIDKKNKTITTSYLNKTLGINVYTYTDNKIEQIHQCQTNEPNPIPPGSEITYSLDNKKISKDEYNNFLKDYVIGNPYEGGKCLFYDINKSNVLKYVLN